jgi:DNA ligase (NAD+)
MHFDKSVVKELKDIAVRAKDAYYNTGKPLTLQTKDLSDDACLIIFSGRKGSHGVKTAGPDEEIKVPKTVEITDKIYDVVESLLSEYGVVLAPRAPASGMQKKIEVDLPYPLPSLTKAYPGDNQLAKYLKKNPSDRYMVSKKMDGLTLEIVFHSGEVKVYTGTEVYRGKDVSYLAPYLKLPKVSGDLAIRAEGIISKANFDRYWAEKYKAPRNLAAGVFNKTTGDVHEAAKHIDVVVYEVLEPRGVPSVELEKLHKKGFHIVDYKTTSLPDEEKCASLLRKWKASSTHEIDGLVITVDKKTPVAKADYSPQSIALKVNDEASEVETTVTDVVYEASKYGVLAPVVHFNPIKVGGVTVSKATAHNAKMVVDKGIGIGAVIKVIRSGDVIPYVHTVVKKAKPTLPDPKVVGEYAWDKTKVQLVLKDRSKSDTAVVKALYSFLAQGLGVEHLAEATIARCYAVGMTHIGDYLKATPKDFLRAEGVKDTNANKFYQQIQKACKAADINKVAAYSGYFGRNFGSKRMALITAKYDLFKLQGKDPKTIYQKVIALPGFSAVLAKQFAENLHAFCTAALLWPIVYHKEEPTTVAGNKMEGQQVVFTGFRDAEIEKWVQENGGQIGSGVSGKTTILLTKDAASGSAKAEAARAKGVKVYTRDTFLTKYLS